MNTVPLNKVARVDISNVDKKCKEGEAEVVLCNFVDVYHNWAITKDMASTLMKATANAAQIDRFSIHKGQVAITKDSETRDDIGVPTYIADDIENGVLGYHCALITPNEKVLKGKYLNIILNSPYAKKYFEANASGSGQRYTLTNDVIESFPVPIPDDISIQEVFGDLCSDIDSKISNNKEICYALEKMTKLLYDYWFVQFDFPNENGKPYKSSGGKMVWNDDLKREIPEGWDAAQLHNICNVNRGASPRPIDKYMDPTNNGMPWVKISDATSSSSPYLLTIKESIILEGVPKSVRVYPGTLIVSNSATPGIPKFIQIDACVHDGWLILSGYKPWYKYYLYFVIGMVRNSLLNIASGSIFKNLKTDYLKEYWCVSPPEHILKAFDKKILPLMEKIMYTEKENIDLTNLRNYLIPMLMNGQVKVGKAGA